MKARKSKTMWFAFALVIFGALFDLFPTLHEILDPRFYSISLVVIGIVVAILRFVTTQPLDNK
jgi:hypothetical protein